MKRPRAQPAAAPEPSAPAPNEDAGAYTEESLYDAIAASLLKGRLRPGTPLRERYLAEEFGVTRGMVRKVLLRLGREGKLELHANRGAFVPQPTREQVLEAYQARKALEAGMLALLARNITSTQISRLKAHLQAERNASRQARRDESVKLAGDFHLLVAELLGNAQLGKMLELLIARTQMYVALFEPAHSSACAAEEHEPVVAALARRDVAEAVRAMLDHLTQVEQRVLARITEEEPRVADILRSALKEKP